MVVIYLNCTMMQGLTNLKFKISPPQLAVSQRAVTCIAHPNPVFSHTRKYINFQNQKSSGADISPLRKLRSSQPDIPKEAGFEKHVIVGLRMA
jgi:hypothetical protein